MRVGILARRYILRMCDRWGRITTRMLLTFRWVPDCRWRRHRLARDSSRGRVRRIPRIGKVEFWELDRPIVESVCTRARWSSRGAAVGDAERPGLVWCPWAYRFRRGRCKLLLGWFARVFGRRNARPGGVAWALHASGRPQHQRMRSDALARAGVLTGCGDQKVVEEDTPNGPRVVGPF